MFLHAVSLLCRNEFSLFRVCEPERLWLHNSLVLDFCKRPFLLMINDLVNLATKVCADVFYCLLNYPVIRLGC